MPPPGSRSATPSLAGEEFQLLNEFLEAKFGLHFPEHKREVLESRLGSRLRALHLSSFMDYYLTLESGADGEVRQLARAVTNNLTYFFRESYQFEALYGVAIEDLQRSPAVPGSLRILCAGCSSGEEAYTLNIYSSENRFRAPGLQLRIDAFDLDDVRVEMARRAAYRPRSLQHMDDGQIARYLIREAPDRFRLKPAHRARVYFTVGNIVDLYSFQRTQLYDVVFCRNVLIYFSDTALRRAVENFARVLRPGGLLFLGHSESIIGMFDFFETVRLNRCIAYRRVRP